MKKNSDRIKKRFVNRQTRFSTDLDTRINRRVKYCLLSMSNVMINFKEPNAKQIFHHFMKAAMMRKTIRKGITVTFGNKIKFV